MNIIWVTPELPWPMNTGGRIGMMKRIEYFSEKNEIYLFSIIDSKDEIRYIKELKKYCKEVHLYNRKEKMIINLLKCLWGPYICSSRWKHKMKNEIETKFRNEKIDYIIVDFPQMLGNISKYVLDSGKVVLNQHNLEMDALYSNAKSIRNFPKKIIYLFEAKRLEWLEKQYYIRHKIILYTFVSREDKEKFEIRYGLNNTLLVPVGIDKNDETKKIYSKKKSIMFVGKMSYPSNVNGIVWFVKNVWPQIHSTIKDVKLYLVGKDPNFIVSQLASDNIIVTGTVDSVQQYYDKASVIIIPLLNGGGVKVKLMEAFSNRKLVVSTSKGVEGTDFINKKHLLVTDDPSEFAKNCILLLEEPEKYNFLADAAYKKAINEYSWQNIVRDFESQLLCLKTNQ